MSPLARSPRLAGRSTEPPNRLMEEIDLVAEVLTSDRRHFCLKPHSTPGSCKPVGPQPDSYDAEWGRRKAEPEEPATAVKKP